jgi:pimeloyl-ACP methyl ester carboxylesterase
LITSVLTIAAIVVIGLPLLMYLAQDSLIFHPQPSAPASGAESIFIEAHDGRRLHAWHVPGSPLVLYFGGNAESVSWMASEARRQAPGSGWLLVDYRGYGRSEGSPSEKALVADSLKWHEKAQSLAASVFVFGRSLGSGVAVQLAAMRPVDGVILVAPYDSMVEVGRHHYPILPVDLMLKHRFESVRHAPKVQAPLLCLVAERDEIIPMVHSRRLYEAWGGPKRWVELAGAGHNDMDFGTDRAPLFWSAIRGFLDKKA